MSRAIAGCNFRVWTTPAQLRVVHIPNPIEAVPVNFEMVGATVERPAQLRADFHQTLRLD